MTTIATLLAALSLAGAPIQIGPPPGPGVECREATIRDEDRGFTVKLRLCFRTSPLHIPRGKWRAA